MPVLDFVETVYYSDFNTLGSERNNGMSLGSIPITKITEYALQEGIYDIDLFKRIILRIDRYYSKLVNEENSKKVKSKSKGK